MMSLHGRLLKGAKVIGQFWRDGLRCSAGWAPSCPDPEEDKTNFCKAKMRWVELAQQDARELPDTPEGIPWGAMLSSEFDATGITMTINHPEHGLIRVGPKGEILMRDLVKLETAPEALEGFLKILKVFPKAAVVRSEAPPPEVAGPKKS